MSVSFIWNQKRKVKYIGQSFVNVCPSSQFSIDQVMNDLLMFFRLQFFRRSMKGRLLRW